MYIESETGVCYLQLQVRFVFRFTMYFH